MSSSDGKSTGADEIATRTEDLGPVGRVVGDSTAVLEVLGVSEKNGADDLVADSSAGVTDGGGGESGTLTVTDISGCWGKW